MVQKFGSADGIFTRPTWKLESLLSMFRRAYADSSTLRVPAEPTVVSGAGWVMADIALPVPVAWGEGVVPAGEYAMVVPSWTPLIRVFLEGAGHDAVIVPASVEKRRRGRRNVLTLVRDGSIYHVRSLEFRQPGLLLHFDTSLSEPTSHDTPSRR